jgi:hypothetical protein
MPRQVGWCWPSAELAAIKERLTSWAAQLRSALHARIGYRVDAESFLLELL